MKHLGRSFEATVVFMFNHNRGFVVVASATALPLVAFYYYRLFLSPLPFDFSACQKALVRVHTHMRKYVFVGLRCF